jgi:hypothetical protein
MTRGKVVVGALGAAIAAPAVLLILNVFGVGLSLGIRIWPTGWAVRHAAHVQRPSGDLLIVMADDVAIGSRGHPQRLLVLSAANGSVLGERVGGVRFELFGLTPELAWCRHSREDGDFAGYELPGLTKRYDGDDLLAAHPRVGRIIDWIKVDGPNALRIDAKDGYQYRLELVDNSLARLPERPPPLVPNLLHAYAGCRWRIPGPMKDARTCAPIRLPAVPGRGRRSAGVVMTDYRRDRTTGLEQLVLYLERRDGQSGWRLTEDEVFGPRDGKRSRPIRLASRAHDRLLLVAVDHEPDDLYLAAVRLEDGAVLWRQTFH